MTKHASEKEITASVIAQWKKRGRPNTLVASVPNQRAFGQPGLHRGIFDLIVIAPNLPCAFLELKAEKGQLSPHQYAFGEVCAAAGVPHAVAYSIDEAVALLEEWGAIKPAAAPKVTAPTEAEIAPVVLG